MSLPTPPELGLPISFPEWRPGQDDQLTRILMAPERFVVNAAPVGTGKSLVNVGVATSQGGRLQYTTSTRGLQDQLRADMASIGLYDVRGMGNYPCLILPERRGNNCDRGPCLIGEHCDLRFNGCLYYDALREARSARLVSTNYALHLSLARNDEGLGRRDVLVLDEAHEAAELLSNFMRVTLDPDETNSTTWPVWHEPDAIEPWQEWAATELGGVTRDFEDAVEGSEERRKLKRLKQDLERLTKISSTERWVWQWDDDKVILEPIWSAPYAESMLYRGIERVVLSSATIRPAYLKYLGLKAGDYAFLPMLSPFPASRRPIVQLETGAALKWNADERTLHYWMRGIDSIIDGRLDRKGIIHAVSFKRARHIYNSSRHHGIMLLPERGNTREVVARFKAMKAPAVLVSPSVHTGYDFPYDAARYQIVAKIPFAPITQNAILKLRQLEDPEYSDLLTVSVLEQTAGRVVRAYDDLGETFIVDDQGIWFHKARRALFSAWYNEAYRRTKTVPKAPKL